nr:hypothetical protein [Tanacetum cinerariifolium]
MKTSDPYLKGYRIKFTYLYLKILRESEREVMKRAGFDLQQGSSKRQILDQQTEETKEEAKAKGARDQEVEEGATTMAVAKTGLAMGTTSLPVGTCSSAGVLEVGIDPLPVGTSTTPLAKHVAASMEFRTVAISSESSLILSVVGF